MCRELYEKIDRIFIKVNDCRKEPKFSDEVNSRNNKFPNTNMSQNELLEKMATLICFSQNAKASAVDKMINKPEFAEIFQGFDINSVANMNPHKIISESWELLKPIRFKGKINSIVKCAVVKVNRNYR